MAVVELRGKVDGKEIVFERASEEEWKAQIPRELFGYYVVELEAFDEAGNRAFITKFLLTVDLEALAIKLVPCNYRAGLVGPAFESEPYLSPYTAHLSQERGGENELDDGTWRGEARQAQG